MKLSKRQARVNWILEHADAIKEARQKYQCPDGCRSQCRNGATCAISSYGGWGFWAQAFRLAEIKCEPMNYWSGSKPTPSTSISMGIAEYICSNAPGELL